MARSTAPIRAHALLALVLVASALACATPVSVQRVSAQSVHRSLTGNTLTADRPSDEAIQALHRRDLLRLHQSDPAEAIRRLRTAMLDETHRRDLLYALAELEFHLGQRQAARWILRPDPRPHFLAAAFYAEEFFRSLPPSGSALPVDRRLRVAADIYNRGLAAGLSPPDSDYVDLSSRTLALPFGELTLDLDPAELLWGGYRMTDFVPASELEIRGLQSRFRRPGIGAPLAAALEPASEADHVPGAGNLSPMLRVPASAVAIFDGGLDRPEGDRVRAEMLLQTLDEATSITIGEVEVALEYEPSAALAFGLAESRPWELDRRRFLSGDFGRDTERGVSMLAPYDPDRIPVVLVHGTVSSPWRWAEMVNQLTADETVLARYQFWLFQFNSGNPVPFSAGLLREKLTKLVAELDPEGDDDNLRRMVVVGHSQGGLLAKLCVVESGDAFWNLVSTAPIDEFSLRPETRETLERSLFFEPLPFVERVILIATPFQGSFLAERWFVRLAAGMASASRELGEAASDLLIQEDDRVLLRELDRMPSSVDNMASDNPALQVLAQLPIAPDVEAHNIIAVSVPNEDPALAHDGVVSVESQRHPNVVTEFVVSSGHSVQRHPIAIGEVARILRDGLPEDRDPSR